MAGITNPRLQGFLEWLNEQHQEEPHNSISTESQDLNVLDSEEQSTKYWESECVSSENSKKKSNEISEEWLPDHLQRELRKENAKTTGRNQAGISKKKKEKKTRSRRVSTSSEVSLDMASASPMNETQPTCVKNLIKEDGRMRTSSTCSSSGAVSAQDGIQARPKKRRKRRKKKTTFSPLEHVEQVLPAKASVNGMDGDKINPASSASIGFESLNTNTQAVSVTVPFTVQGSNVSTLSYKDALLKRPAKDVENTPPNKCTEPPSKSPQKHSKLKPKVKQKIDHMLTDVGGTFLFLCERCLTGRFPRMKIKSSRGSFCDSPDRHPWEANKVMVHRSPKKPYPAMIRHRPKALQQNIRAKICPSLYSCRYGSKCRHAHNPVEIKVWNIGSVTHADIVKRCTVDTPPTGYCCSLCNRIFQVPWELENHTNTQEHKTNMTLDLEREWVYREPPDNIINGEYLLCPSVKHTGGCIYSDSVPSENVCPKAHSVEELEEWRERYGYRQMKLLKAKQQNIFSFMDDLQSEYAATDSEIDVISHLIPKGVRIDSNNDSEQYVQATTDGVYRYKWTFKVHCPDKKLVRVGLLHDQYRVHFCLSSPKNVTDPQVCPGDKICSPDSNDYHINVLFKSRIRGRYEQWAIFDFGEKPVLKQMLVVHAGMDDSEMAQDRNQAPVIDIVWDGSNTKIIPYFEDREDEMKKLEIKYKLIDFQVSLEKDSAELTRDNYKKTMDQLLRIEEKATQEKLSRFCMETVLEISNAISLDVAAGTSTLYAQNDNLFGKIHTTQSVFDDSDASQIALSNVNFILIKFNPKSTKVYEAQIVTGEADGRTRDALYVRLTTKCVQEMKLTAKQRVKVEIQFRLNRLHFCIMRWAVEQLICTRILFPTKNEYPALICPQTPDPGSKFNRLQEGAVRFLREKGGSNSKTPLLLLYGPFGTGKTYTLANGIMSALTDADTRILICTHTNSAADLYITEYLDEFVTTWKSRQFKMEMVRVYATDRDLRMISPIVQKYMLFDQFSIKKADEWDIRGKRIVITTTSSASQLASFPRLRGYFTHILIDEAAQVLETEAIIPLILSMPNTCVVLAGDHIQMGPKVYSSQGRDSKFHKSLLERLFEHCLRNRCHRQILLRNNYRTHEDILAFLSKVFYSAEDLEACGNQPRHPLYYPLEFRAVNGYDMVVGNSYVNRYEVLEAVIRAQEILNNWPDDWPADEKDPQEQIGVFAPYRAQVQQLRREFRIRGLPRVFVDSLQGVQGKQFRVIIVSTVRTQKTINKNDDNQDTQYYLGFLSDLRQLNTALTRAQSLVVVVGNPIALCSLGECCNVWKKYIKECERNESLYPKGTAYQDIRLAISAATTTLDPNAAMFIPQGMTVDGSYAHNPDADRSHQVMQNSNGTCITTDPDSDDDVIDFNTDDLILQELRRQLRRDRRRQDHDDDNEDYDSSEENTDEEIKMTSGFRMVEEDDYVRIMEYDDDDDDQHYSRNRQEISTGKTVSCIFHLDLDGRRYAIPTDAANDDITEITIGNHSQRGTAMDGDEVTIEILANDEDDDKRTSEELKKVYGKVISVDKLAVDYTNKELVCLADPYSNNLMVPVNRRLPKIMFLRGKRGGGNRPSGHLIVPICRVVKRHGRDQTEKRDVIVSNKDRPHKLFKVKWLRWRKPHHYPVGFVMDELPPGDNKKDGVAILKQVYEVQPQDDSIDLLEEYPLDWSIPQDEYTRRTDLRNQLTFTIDPPDSEDLDDALSVQQLEDGRYVVGVHIADVSYFVNRETKLGQSLDSKARRMATSFYPASEKPIHMLPLRLSTDLCSLKPGQDKLTISVFLTFDETGKRIPNETRIMRSIVHSNVRLTYDDAEQIIRNNHELSQMEELKNCLHVLSCISCACRKARLGNAAFSQLRGDTLTHPVAHILVEELMILANESVARYLMSQLPQCTPLRRQLPPVLDHFRSWKENNQGVIDESSHLTHAKETLQSVLNDNTDNGNDRIGTLHILHNIWHQIKQFVIEDRLFPLGGLVCTDQYHPQLAAAQSALHRILFNGEYINSGDHASGARTHSSLSKAAYTHFTSPIRRYIDIVVHRLLIAAINKDKTLPHDAQDVAQVCHTCNIRSFAAKEFQLKTHALELALQLKQHPMQLQGVIEALTDKNLQLGFNHDDRVNEALKKSKVAFNLLKPVEKPELEEGDKTVTMKWKERVYHVGGMPSLNPNDIRVNQARHAQLKVDNNRRHILEIPTQNWRCINTALAEGNREEVKRQIRALDMLASSRRTLQFSEIEDPRGPALVEDVTCEVVQTNDDSKQKHYATFKHTFEIGNVTQVQLYPTFNRGIMAPTVQLYQMTPTLHYCMEHRGQPVQCLSIVADHMPKRKDIKTYQETWLPLLDMMAAYNAVQQNETVIIQGMNIEWQHHSSDPLPNGSFTLTKKFCDDRRIDISPVKASGRRAAFLCIRFPVGEEAKETSAKTETGKAQDMVVVAHGSAYASDAKQSKEKDPEKIPVNVFFEVNQMSVPFPKRLRKSNDGPGKYTVEIIPVCYPDSRLEGAIKDVDSSTSLVQNICLLTPNKAEYDSDYHANHMEILKDAAKKYGESFVVPGCKLNRLNRPQSEAVEKALTNRFTVIQGPPGTGKTVTGAYLVYFFSEINKQLPSRGRRPQILYCGPSNKSVDVIAEYLKNFPISIVRAYGKEIEYREFPIPGLPRTSGKMGSVTDVTMDPRHGNISLHHLIRMKNRTDGLEPNSNADAILAYDRRFRTPNYEAERAEVTAYLKLIFKAELEELEKHQVILTTCNAAGSGRIIGNPKNPTNIIQCIVDEAGMCNEPETLIPLVSTKPLQIVLIGDHKQLRPIVPEPTARLLGMEISLLQRYAKQMKMLTIQYRMHEAICRFPSMTFYDNRLITPPVIKKRDPPILLRGVWPGDGSQPMAFCHCSGMEETLSVKTAEGNEMSKANLFEVEQVVRMTRVLVDVYKVNPKEIVILSQYRLQCDKITSKLKQCGRPDVDVRTVTKSQGSEWNYVLMSTVRSLPRVEIEENPNYGWRKKFLGFITDANQMNVALTRAKHGLIIVGNKHLLRTHKLWKDLLDYYEEKNCLVDAKQFLRHRGNRRSPRY